MNRTLLAVVWACLTTAACSLAAAQDDTVPTESVPTLTFDELREKYALPQSRFVEADGVRLHYVDEGEGPVVLLLHASYHSLRSWDPLAERLRQHYRVIRFDFPNAGLSIDAKPAPSDKFSMMGRYQDAIDHLAAHLELDQFSLVATSSGGAAGFRYASKNPDKVARLVLINTAGMPRIPSNDPLRERGATARWAGMKVRPREFWEFGMSTNFITPNEPPAWLIDQAYDFARREGRAEKSAEYAYSTGDPQAILAGIRSPTLILWGKSNPTVMHLEADVIQHWMTSAPTTVRKYEGLGHYPYIEDPDAVYSDLAAFLSGELDPDLRRTVMMKAGDSGDCPTP